MKRFVNIILLLWFAGTISASDIECVGLATQILNDEDTLFFFRNEIHLRSTIGNVDWYATDGTLVASNTDELYPDEGGYYIVSADRKSMPVYAFLYSEPGDFTTTVIPDCGATTIRITGDAKPFIYTRPDLSMVTYKRTCTVNYNVLAWNTEEWVDSASTMVTTLHDGNYVLPPLYGATPISFCYDTDIRVALGLDTACIETELPADSVKAVKLELTSLATARGTEGEKSNERNRPVSQTLITGSEYSGPHEVAFYSNPAPAVQYYAWTIYRSTNVIATRQDRDVRYVFSEPGSYRVVCKVNNAYCISDSMEVAVTVSESYLAAPNVFTPNGDGKNDEFRVAYRSLKEFHCWVYNRWGKLVFEWTDPAKGWDGTINGRPAPEGAYYYVIRAKGTDAAKNADYIGLKAVYEKKKISADEAVIGIYQLSGDINLLRGKK